MTSAAPAALAACTMFNPTPPHPITTTESPARTRATPLDGSEPGDHGAAEQGGRVERDRLADDDDRAAMDHHLLGQCTDVGELVERRLPPHISRLGASSGAHRCRPVAAQRVLATPTPAARPALDDETDDDVLSGGDAVDVAADFGDDA